MTTYCSRTLHECVDWNERAIQIHYTEESRTLHECVDWNKPTPAVRICNQKVALYTSAWIEIINLNLIGGNKFVALYTSAWIEITRLYPCLSCAGMSHSTRVRGLKFMMFPPYFRGGLVALYTSAWIEIVSFATVMPCNVSRTLHECVDWNALVYFCALPVSQSHSTRVRGLKWVWHGNQSGGAVSHSTRVRGLKSQKIATVNNFKPSHSTRVRGLKFIIVEIRKTKRKVALYTSAWIEITYSL